MIAVIAATAAFCWFHSGYGRWSRHAGFSLVALVVTVVFFACVVLMKQQLWAKPLFAVGCVVLPCAVYAMAVRSGSYSKKRTVERRPDARHRGCQVESVSLPQTSAHYKSKPPAQRPAPASTPKFTVLPVSQPIAPPASKQSSSPVQEYYSTPAPVLEFAPAPAPAPTPTPTPKPAPEPKPAPKPKPKPEPKPAPEPEPDDRSELGGDDSKPDDSGKDAELIAPLRGKTLSEDVESKDGAFAASRGATLTQELIDQACAHDALLLLTLAVDE